MKRIYLTNKLKSKAKKFKALANKLGAEYIEEGKGLTMVFPCKTKAKNDYRVGAQIYVEGKETTIGVGRINEKCNNLEQKTLFNPTEFKWLVKMLKTIEKGLPRGGNLWQN